MADASAENAAEAALDYNYEEGAGDGVGDDDMDEIQAMLANAQEAQTEVAQVAESGKAEAADALAKKEQEEKARQEIDDRSVFVTNVHFNTTVEQLVTFFSTCGQVERATIISDKFGQPKGYAYVEFANKESVSNAVMLSDSEFNGRPIKILRKRTNLPPHMLGRGRARGRGGPHMGGGRGAPRGRGRGGMPMFPMMMPAPFMAASGMFYMPRGGGYGRGGGRGGGGYRGRGGGRGGAAGAGGAPS